MNLKNYLQDGANAQARAVLMLMQDFTPQSVRHIEKDFTYYAHIDVARWENCREQGYILSMRNSTHKEQLNIIFFEHRNSDRIHAVKWKQNSMNSINIDTAKFGDVYKDKYDTSFAVDPGQVSEMCEWICQEFSYFWEQSFNPAHEFEFSE